MKILLVGNYSADQQYSMQGFAGALKAGLESRGVEVRLVAPRPRLGQLGAGHAGAAKWLGYVDKFALFPSELRRAMAWADLVHVCDQGNAMYLRYLQEKPHLLTCHDVLAIRSAMGDLPEWSTGATGRVYQKLILAGLKLTRHMVCVSEATRQDTLRLTGLAPETVGLIYNGLYGAYSPMPGEESDGLLEPLGIAPGRPFFLHVGGNQPYKNRPMVLEIFRALRGESAAKDAHLVLAGKPLPQAMRDRIAEYSLGDYVLTPSGLSNEHLRALYSRATGLVFPSLYEGFGLPIIEAQACGCPAFTSDRAPMTEVGGSAAVYFDPTRPNEAAQKIAASLADRSRMAQAGLENVRRFTQDRMLEEYIRAYTRILSG